MISPVINSLRALKGLYDLAFSEDQFCVEQEAEFLGRVRHCIEQAKEGYLNPFRGKRPEAVQNLTRRSHLCLAPRRADRGAAKNTRS
jgi:hypothetical protein